MTHPNHTPAEATEVFCSGCGYNLHALAADAHCPECGRVVSESLGLPAPEWGNAAWLAWVRRGCWLILAGQGVFVVAVGLALSASRSRDYEAHFAGFALVVALLLDGWGALWIVHPVPRDEPALERSRLLVRLTAFLPLAGLLVKIAEVPVAGLAPHTFGQSVFALTWGICIWFTFDYVERLARRARLRSAMTLARVARLVLAPIAAIGLSGLVNVFAAGCVGLILAAGVWLAAILALLDLASTTTSFPRRILVPATPVEAGATQPAP